MRWFPIFSYLAIGAWQVAVHIDAIWPDDPAKREALRLCFFENHRFNPLDAAARDKCFKEVLQVRPTPEKLRFAQPVQRPR